MDCSWRIRISDTTLSLKKLEMASRCLELLALPSSEADPSHVRVSWSLKTGDHAYEVDQTRPSLILDIGCGSGLSGEILEDEGHIWCGVDISGHMLGQSYRLLDLTGGFTKQSL
jgi:SAM-dependent methyltransferase